VVQLSALQDILFAQGNWGLLLIFQAMDAAGKDGTIKHVMSGVNPQGVNVYSFKAPSAEELAHTFMWRSMGSIPPRGRLPSLIAPTMKKSSWCVSTRNFWTANTSRIPARQALVARPLRRHQLVRALSDAQRHRVRKFFLNISKKSRRSASWSA